MNGSACEDAGAKRGGVGNRGCDRKDGRHLVRDRVVGDGEEVGRAVEQDQGGGESSMDSRGSSVVVWCFSEPFAVRFGRELDGLFLAPGPVAKSERKY